MPSILHQLETTEAPPTYYKTNKFTEGFQGLVESYGVACYREANPGLNFIRLILSNRLYTVILSKHLTLLLHFHSCLL